MDPEAALGDAERAYRHDEFEEAFAALRNYRTWREGGGFEPKNGDARAKELLDKLVRATGGYDSGWGEAADYVEGYDNPARAGLMRGVVSLSLAFLGVTGIVLGIREARKAGSERYRGPNPETFFSSRFR